MPHATVAPAIDRESSARPEQPGEFDAGVLDFPRSAQASAQGGGTALRR